MAAANLSTGERLAVLETQASATSFTYTGGYGPGGRLAVANVGVNAVAISYGSSFTNTTASSAPAQAADEYILPAGGVLVLPSGVNIFYHYAESGRLTTLSVSVAD
jgi:hypothetical protein